MQLQKPFCSFPVIVKSALRINLGFQRPFVFRLPDLSHGRCGSPFFDRFRQKRSKDGLQVSALLSCHYNGKKWNLKNVVKNLSLYDILIFEDPGVPALDQPSTG
jgi:hypothetical protein